MHSLTIILVWQRFLGHIWSVFGLRIVLLVMATVIAGALDGLGMALLLPLLQLAGINTGAAQQWSFLPVALLRDHGISPSLEMVLATMVAIYLIQSGVVYVQGRMTAWIETSYVSYWRERLLQSFLAASWSYLSSNPPGKLTYTLVSDAERLGRTFSLTIQLLSVTSLGIAFLTLSLLVSWAFTLAMIVASGLIITVMSVASSRAGYKYGQSYTAHLGELQTLVTDVLTGAKAIKANAAEPFVMERVRPLNKAINDSYFGTVAVPYFNRAVMELAAVVVFCVLLYVGIRLMHLPAETILVLMAIFVRLAPKLHVAQYTVQLLSTYIPTFQRIECVYDEAYKAREHYPGRAEEVSLQECPSVNFHDVTVRYGSREALSHVSLHLEKCRTIGVIGVSGSGKSTLADCIVGLTAPTEGSVFIAGRSIQDLDLRKWRSLIGYVGQDTVLIEGTVREILCQGEAVSDSTMRQAAKLAHADSFIADLPDSYDTRIGARGIQLSGGQKQRLALARALARRPVLLVLDEPTSALDPISEAEIFAAIRDLRGRMTILIVSHRLAAVRDAHSIILLDKGQVVAHGNWEDLHAVPLLQRLLVGENAERDASRLA